MFLTFKKFTEWEAGATLQSQYFVHSRRQSNGRDFS